LTFWTLVTVTKNGYVVAHGNPDNITKCNLSF